MHEDGTDKIRLRNVKVCSCEALISYLSVLIFHRLRLLIFTEWLSRPTANVFWRWGWILNTSRGKGKNGKKTRQRYYSFLPNKWNATQRNEKRWKWYLRTRIASPAATRHHWGRPKRLQSKTAVEELLCVWQLPARPDVVGRINVFSPGPFTSFFLVRTTPWNLPSISHSAHRLGVAAGCGHILHSPTSSPYRPWCSRCHLGWLSNRP